MQPSTQELQPGTRLADRYRVEYLLAEGGMASIYVATDEVAREQVAVKSLYGHYSRNKIVRERFLDEGRIQRALRHPNIVHVKEVLHEPVLAFIMEYVNGPTLDEHLATRGPMDLAELLKIMIPVFSAIGLAHRKGIIHRDIKPSNILLTQDIHGELRPMVMDFGVAKVGRTEGLTATGTTVGTLHYMSPEQIVGSKQIDGRADIYSLGVTLYKLAAGEVPFNAPTEFALMMAQVESRPRPPSEINRSIDPGLEAIILRALNKRPQDRFQNIKEMTEAMIALGNQDDQTRRMTIKASTHDLLQIALRADGVAQDHTEQVVFTELLRELPREQAEQMARSRGIDLATVLGPADGRHDATSRIDETTLERLRQQDIMVLGASTADLFGDAGDEGFDDDDLMAPATLITTEESQRVARAYESKLSASQEVRFDDGETVELLRSNFKHQFGARPFGGAASDSSDDLPDLADETREREPPRIHEFQDIDSGSLTRPVINSPRITVSDPSGSISRDRLRFGASPAWATPGDDDEATDTQLIEPLPPHLTQRPPQHTPTHQQLHHPQRPPQHTPHFPTQAPSPSQRMHQVDTSVASNPQHLTPQVWKTGQEHLHRPTMRQDALAAPQDNPLRTHNPAMLDATRRSGDIPLDLGSNPELPTLAEAVNPPAPPSRRAKKLQNAAITGGIVGAIVLIVLAALKFFLGL